MSEYQPKMYIFINSDLEMSSGKIASQCCHVTHVIVDELVRDGYESFPASDDYKMYLLWNKHCTKIILKASNEQLLELMKHKSARAFYDNGKTTQVESGSLTVVGFFPSCNLEELVKEYKLL